MHIFVNTYLCKLTEIPLITGSGTNISQNLDKIGRSNLYLSSIIIKNLVVWLKSSIHRLNADCASIVNLSALNSTILLNSR